MMTSRSRQPAPPTGARAIALTAGPGALRALRVGALGTVELALGRGGYVHVAGRWLLLAHPRAPLGPLSLLVGGLPVEGLRVGDRVVVHGSGIASSTPATLAPGRAVRLVVGDLGVELEGVRSACTPIGARGARAEGWRAALDAVLGALPAPPASLVGGLRALAAGDRPAGWMRLAGLGAGLTPAGDDVLAGHAAWCWWAGEPVAPPRPALARCAPLGAAYVACARRGELPGPAAAVLAAIRGGDVTLARRRSATLAQWGATSGMALAWGFGAAAGTSP